jgi:segregation and condensation protein B
MDDNIHNSDDKSIDANGLEENRTKAIIEALVIATTEPLPLRSIAEIVNVPETAVRSYIDELNKEYRDSARAFEIREIAGGFQIYTLPSYAEWVGALHKRKERLSKAALETLAIIAYHQPIIRAEIEKIRGVDSTWVLDTLLRKNLIKTCGRMHSPGRPIKYGTTKEFLRYFGIKDISELPKEEDFGETVMGGYPEVSSTSVEEAGKQDELSQDEALQSSNKNEDSDL